MYATDFLASFFFSSVIAFLRDLQSDSVCPILSQYSHLGYVSFRYFFAMMASFSSAVNFSHPALGNIFRFSLSFLFLGSLAASLARTIR